ncbi:MAG: DUF366 family protein [Firmicutes bacterium]|nr:DUF366 family protein [Bacillota bacterium]
MIRHIFPEQSITYNGVELAPHWIYNNFDIRGNAIVAFTGECKVSIGSMVDLADVKENAHIYSPLMLHFIAEIFDEDLEKAVYRQRLLTAIIKEELERRGIQGVERNGDDIFCPAPDGGKGKLSVSIATKSTVSTLIHFGINIKTEGTPVKTSGLEFLGVDPRSFGQSILKLFCEEFEDIFLARCKVRGVPELK